MRALVTEFESPAAAGQAELGETLITLIRMACQEHRTVEAQPSASDALREKIVSFVNFHLASPDLSVNAIADALGCSKRHVHRLFKTGGQPCRTT